MAAYCVSKMSLFVLLCLCALSSASLLNFLKMPVHDGTSRVKHFNEEQIVEATSNVSAPGTHVLLVEDGNVTDAGCNCHEETGNFSEVLAQLVSSSNISVLSLKIKNSQLLSESLYKLFGVHVFVNGKHFVYRGKREIPALLSYLKKVTTNTLKVINGKLDKLAFDAVLQNKVVGFFVNGTGDYQAFEIAAKNMAPEFAFYVVFDRVVARHLKLDTVGQIHLHKPSQKLPLPCPVNPASALDIENFVQQNGLSAFFYLTEDNLEDTLVLDLSSDTVIAIGEKASAVGGYFNRLLAKVVRNSTDNKYDLLNVIWIDPESFPVITMMKDYLSKTYGMPRVLPAMGIVDFSTNKSAWFSSQLLNMTADKRADDQNVAMIKDWLSGVVDSTLLLQTNKGSQTLIRAPRNIETEEGSNFELDCIVQNIIGDCLWLHNGQNIGFNLERLPHLSWVGEPSLGDCSLRFTSAMFGRDDGSWICEVTGDQINPTVSSIPVEVVVKPKAAPATVATPPVPQEVKTSKSPKTDL